MSTAQPGIFALGTRSHYHLELHVHHPEELVAALAGLREPAVTAGGVNLVIGFGPDTWRTLAGDDEVPLGFEPFDAIEGIDQKSAPATQHDLWLWAHGVGDDVVFDAAGHAVRALAPAAELADERACFVFKDSRDLTGFIDGTANPPVVEAPGVGLVPDGQPGAGGSHVIVQRWRHDLEAFGSLPVEQQEAVFGRSKADSVEMDDEHKPVTAHIARVEVDDDNGDELEIYRRSTPWGDLREQGLQFLGFSAEQRRFRLMLDRMFGRAGDGIRDHLLDYSTPVTGAFYFAPSLEALAALEAAGSA